MSTRAPPIPLALFNGTWLPYSQTFVYDQVQHQKRLEATVWVAAEVRTTYRVTGTANIEGTRCLMIESESAGTLSDGFAHGADVPFSGKLQGTATWCFDTESGVLVEMIGEEVTDGGTQSPQGAGATIKQTTKIEIHNVTAT